MPNLTSLFTKLSATVCAMSALSLPLMASVKAQDRPKILIINSDNMVSKYRQVKDSFLTQMASESARTVEASPEQIQSPESLAQFILNENPDLIYSIGSKAYQLASESSKDKPLLFSSVINWQRFESKKGYGVANELSLSQELSLLRYILPDLRRVGVLYDPAYSKERVAEARSHSAEVGLTLVEQVVSSADDLPNALDTLLPKVDVLWLIADPSVLANREAVEMIFSKSNEQKKPVYTYSDAFLSNGASLVVAADTPTMGRQAANLAHSILHREPLSETVQTPAGSHITLNLCQLSKLNANYNSDALDSVNQLLECR